MIAAPIVTREADGTLRIAWPGECANCGAAQRPASVEITSDLFEQLIDEINQSRQHKAPTIFMSPAVPPFV